MDLYLLGSFLIATLLVVMAPGPVMAIVAHNTLRGGTAAGLLTVVGVELGELGLLTATFMGVMVSAELFPVLFRWLGLAGTLYLAWLAATALRSHDTPVRSTTATCARMPVVEGLTVAFANPATIVFYAAFFPQFLHPDRPVARQTVALGAIYLFRSGFGARARPHPRTGGLGAARQRDEAGERRRLSDDRYHRRRRFRGGLELIRSGWEIKRPWRRPRPAAAGRGCLDRDHR